MVNDDLQLLGHSRVYYSDESLDTSNLCTNEVIICVRRGPQDYHFMRYTSDGWLHKPSSTQVLRYRHEPVNGRLWSNEAVRDGVYYPGTLIYNSTIYYISFDGHNWSYATNSNGTHTGYCSICGDSKVESCNYSFTYTSRNRHSGVCTLCGYTKSAPCNSVNKYCGNNTLGDVHNTRCKECDHVTNSYAASCTFVTVYYGLYCDVNCHIDICTKCGYQKGTPEPCQYLTPGLCDYCG